MQPPFRTRRRFIAGAVCPRCAAMDKIIVDLDSDQRECIACGFSDARPSGPAPREPGTRVTRAAARRTETTPQVVKLVDPPAPGQTPGSAAASTGEPAASEAEAPEDPGQ